MTGEFTKHSIEQTENEFAPDPATVAAWEARSHLLSARDSEPGSVQAELAKKQANEMFDVVVRLTSPKLTSSAVSATLLRRGGDRGAVDDILQNTYIKAYKGLIGFRGDAKFETWLHQIMFGVISDYYKKESKHIGRLAVGVTEFGESELDIQEHLMPANLGEDDPVEYVDHKETYENVMEAINQLTPKHRKVLILAHYRDLAHEQIADRLGITVNASKVRLHRARQKLKEILGSNDSVLDTGEDDRD